MHGKSQVAVALGVRPDGVGVHSFNACNLDPSCRPVMLARDCSKHVFGDFARGLQTHPDGAHQRPSTSAAPSCAGNVLLFQWRTGHGQQQTHITVIGETPWWAMAPCRAQYLGWSPVRAIVDFCHNHKKQRNCFPTSEELKGHLLIQISGITCAAWSTMIQTSLGRFDCLSTACLCWADMMRVI